MKLVILWMLVIGSVSSGAQPFTLGGVVTDQAHQPLWGARVTAESENVSLSAFTDQSGRFQLAELHPDTYRITLSHMGYQTATRHMDITENTEQHFILEAGMVMLEEVTINDRHHGRRKKEETLAIEVVGEDFMRTHQGGSLMHTLRRLPGIQAVNVGSGQSKPLIRGLGFNRIVVAEHGIKHEGQQWGSDHALEVDQFAHDHIELIKGPASLIYGSDAIGGVVKLEQRNMAEPGSVAAHIQLTGRSSNQLLGTSASLQGRKQRWSFSSRITWLDYADARVPTDSVDVYSYRVPLYKNRLRNTAGNEQNVHFSLAYAHNHFLSRFFISHVEQKAGFFANAHGLEPRRVDTDLYDRSDRDILYPRQQARHFKLINRTALRWRGIDLVSEKGYQRNFREEFSHYVNHGYMPPVLPDSLPANLERGFEKHTFTANLRATLYPAHSHQLTLGLSAEHQDNHIDGINFLIPAFRQWLSGVYVVHEWEAAPGVRINSGIRYDLGFLNTDAYYDWFPTQGTFLQRSDDLRRRFGSFSGMVGVNYHREKTIVRVNLGRSFRMPLAKELAANGVNYHHFSYEVGDAGLQPETTWQLDAGAEYTDRFWGFRVSPFVSYFPNYIYLNPSHLFDFDHGAGNQIFHYMASEVFRAGGEILLTVHPTENTTVEASAEYTYSQQLSGDKKGFTIPFSPPASALVSFSWHPFKGHAHQSFQELAFMTDFQFTAAQNRIVPPERKTPAYQTMNVGMRGLWKIHHTPVQWHVRVQNLLHTHYLEHTSYYRLIGVPEPGRNISISLNIPLKILQPRQPHTISHPEQ